MSFLSGEGCEFIGMVHLRPLPGSGGFFGDVDAIFEQALSDAAKLVEGGCDALIVENMGDAPYLRGSVDPETTAAMAIATRKIVEKSGIPVGVQVLAGANREALGVAIAAGASFVRVEGYAYAHVADEGWIEACAGELSRARSYLKSDTIEIWADVQKKHAAHAITSDLTLADLARGHAFAGADVLIVTGSATGEPTDPSDVDAARVGLPVAVGSGVTDRNAHRLADKADALIVGTWLKEGSDWRAPVDIKRVRRLRELIDRSESV